MTHEIVTRLRDQVDALHEQNMKLRSSLRNQFCPRPCNGRGSDTDVGDCFDAGECGCSAHAAISQRQP